MTQKEYRNKAVELFYSSKAYADNLIGIPEFIKTMGLQMFVFGVKDIEFEEITRKALFSLMTTGELIDVFDKEK